MQRFLPELSIIAPAYNEAANIRPLVQAVAKAMEGRSWELIIVDDDSPDGTSEEARRVAADGYPVRSIRRVGRRGLASAVVEGALAAHAENIAVIDADMQHDETRLPGMLDLLQSDSADLVIGSRHVDGGGLGDWDRRRQRMSSFATWCAKFALGTTVSDPMSGFFAVKRDVFYACVYDLSQQGYKILLDILSSSPRTLRVVEVPYTFRNRERGESKVDMMILLEFLFLLIEKVTGGVIPPRFVLFSGVGAIGLVLHLAVLQATKLAHFSFTDGQIMATIAAMTLNYVINNSVTYRQQRLHGWSFIAGYFLFAAICLIGGIANIGVADLVMTGYDSWQLAGISGALMSVVFNFGAASQLVWGGRRNRKRMPSVIPVSRTAGSPVAADLSA